ncbi:unnamed protein product [Cercopithifilaria johnstoni]|uniref:Uncharacterized protein n=1 Tax=Cercopithifilaria johnstoni TaxID=2874296 RepID=A0A8J2MDB2_9BILA|nr:unnamed protein product [Cercopithifilaria johnstoni]
MEYPGWAGFYQPNVPFAPVSVPLISSRRNTAPPMSMSSWLLSQGFLLSPLPSILPNNYMFQPVQSNGEHFRRRRSSRIRELSPIWLLPQRTSQSFVPVNNNLQSAGKIVSVVNADPTGGSKIVTRRRQDGHLDVRIIYSREFIVAASASPYALLPPANFRQMVLEMMDIIAKFPKSYYNSIRTDNASGSSD